MNRTSKTAAILTAVVAALGIGALGAGCGVSASQSQPGASHSTIPAKKADAVNLHAFMKPVIVNKGGVVEIRVPGNPSTGFSWQVLSGGRLLHKAGESFTSESDLIGAPGMVVLKFTAVRHGQATLVLGYSRAWEKDQAAAETCAIRICVVDAGGAMHGTATVRPNETISVDRGASVNLALTANPSTGYMWTAQSKLTGVLAEKGEPTFTADSQLDGAPGSYVLHYTAVTAGAEQIVLGYRGPGSDGRVEGSCAVTVVVK